MASISLILLAFIGLFVGIKYFNSKLKELTGSVIIVVTGLVGLYILVTIADLFLSYAGFETGFPSANTGYYLFQSFIYIILGLIAIGIYYYILKDTDSREISYAFWWMGLIILASGCLDLLIETVMRVPSTELKLFVALIIFAVMIGVSMKYKKKLFGKGKTA